LGERIDTPGAWQMPQGGIDDGENIETAAFRELAEEVGTGNAQILRIAAKKLRYDLPSNLQKKLWGGKFAGQEQTWVAMLFTGDDSEIILDAHEPAEFQNWQWAPIENSLDLIVPFKRATYEQVIALFADLKL